MAALSLGFLRRAISLSTLLSLPLNSFNKFCFNYLLLTIQVHAEMDGCALQTSRKGERRNGWHGKLQEHSLKFFLGRSLLHFLNQWRQWLFYLRRQSFFAPCRQCTHGPKSHLYECHYSMMHAVVFHCLFCWAIVDATIARKTIQHSNTSNRGNKLFARNW